MTCMLSEVPVRFLDTENPQDALGHLHDAFAIHLNPVTVVISGFVPESDNAETVLFPNPGNECELHISPWNWGEWEPLKGETSVRFDIEASLAIDSPPIANLCYLDGRLTADGRWEWTLSCDGAPNCTRCVVETRLCA